MQEITDESTLRGVIAEPVRAVAEKAIDHVDVSPRGEAPGSLLVLDGSRRARAGRACLPG